MTDPKAVDPGADDPGARDPGARSPGAGSPDARDSGNGVPAQPDIIETERLVLRRFEASDAGALAEALAPREMAWNMGRLPHPYTLDDARDFLAGGGLDAVSDAHAIMLREGGALVGSAGIAWRSPGCSGDGAAEEVATLGYWIARAHWGRGYASEAVAAKLFEHFARGGGTVHARAFADNPASIGVLRHVGFRDVGGLLDRNLVREGQHPVRLHECTVEDFRAAAWNLGGEAGADGGAAGGGGESGGEGGDTRSGETSA